MVEEAGWLEETVTRVEEGGEAGRGNSVRHWVSCARLCWKKNGEISSVMKVKTVVASVYKKVYFWYCIQYFISEIIS